ncbi:hypothetical protein CB1_000377010 [Camelus ferus]|nr:hypothetical protein CB1_000377010 [Camelus ferus]
MGRIQCRGDIGRLMSFAHCSSLFTASSCDQEQQSALEEARQPKNDNVVIPECAHGGLYKPVQCHPSTGYCWCVLVDTGRPIPGTSTRYEQPKCDNTARAHPARTRDLYKGRQLQGVYMGLKESAWSAPCTAADPSVFGHEVHLMKQGSLETGFLQHVVDSVASTHCCVCSSTCEQTTWWSSGMKQAQKPPAVCVVWGVPVGIVVLQFDVTSGVREERGLRLGPVPGPSNTWGESKAHEQPVINTYFQAPGRPCARAEEGQPAPMSSWGRAHKAGAVPPAYQGPNPAREPNRVSVCHSDSAEPAGYGFKDTRCVGRRPCRQTGGGVLGGGPAPLSARGPVRWTLGVLVDDSLRLSEPDPSHTLEERVVHWYFKLLDKNASGDIGKKEMKPFKRFLRKKSKPKKCVKKFVEYCDVNDDRSISLQELMGCLGVAREEGRTPAKRRPALHGVGTDKLTAGTADCGPGSPSRCAGTGYGLEDHEDFFEEQSSSHPGLPRVVDQRQDTLNEAQMGWTVLIFNQKGSRQVCFGINCPDSIAERVLEALIPEEFGIYSRSHHAVHTCMDAHGTDGPSPGHRVTELRARGDSDHVHLVPARCQEAEAQQCTPSAKTDVEPGARDAALRLPPRGLHLRLQPRGFVGSAVRSMEQEGRAVNCVLLSSIPLPVWAAGPWQVQQVPSTPGDGGRGGEGGLEQNLGKEVDRIRHVPGTPPPNTAPIGEESSDSTALCGNVEDAAPHLTQQRKDPAGGGLLHSVVPWVSSAPLPTCGHVLRARTPRAVVPPPQSHRPRPPLRASKSSRRAPSSGSITGTESVS